MLFKQSDLASNPIQEAYNILNESVYLDESESILSAKAIPVVENNTIGAYVVRFNDIATFAEDHGMNYMDAMSSIAESNGIDMDHLAVAVKETTIMANPGIVNELNNVLFPTFGSPTIPNFIIFNTCLKMPYFQHFHLSLIFLLHNLLHNFQ